MRKFSASRAFKRKLCTATLALILLPFMGACSGSSEAFTIDVQETIPLTIETKSLLAGTVGTVYSFQLSARGGGTQPGNPYQWSQVSVGGLPATLPLGLTLSSTGLISGIPRQSWTPGIDPRLRFRAVSMDTSVEFTNELDFLVVGEAWAPSPGLSSGVASAPLRREGHSAVWAGTVNNLPNAQMIIWGGFGVKYNRVTPADVSMKDYLQDGGVYSQGPDSWSQPANLRAEAPEDMANNLPQIITGAPSARAHHTAVYNGTHMIVWGGEDAAVKFNNGGMYNVATSSWEPAANFAGLNGVGAPTARSEHCAVWSSKDNKMYVFGGRTATGATNELWTYDPAADLWTKLTIPGAIQPEARWGAVMGYDTANDLFIIWGGTDGTTTFSNGYLLSIPMNVWQQPNALTTAAPEGPSARRHAIGVINTTTSTAPVVTTSRFVVWGGEDFTGSLNTGDVFNMNTFRWASGVTPSDISNLSVGTQRPSVRHSMSAINNGNGLIIWGGIGIQSPTNMNEEWGEGRAYIPKK